MASEELLTDALIDWAATRIDEVVFNPKQGFYSFAIVAEAYEKGAKDKEQSLKEEVRKKYFDNAKTANEALSEILKSLSDKGYEPSKLFVNLSWQETSILFAIDEATHNDDTFIDFAYGEVAKLQVKYNATGCNIDISFVDDTPDLNLPLLKSDGFGFAYDFKTHKPIF